MSKNVDRGGKKHTKKRKRLEYKKKTSKEENSITISPQPTKDIQGSDLEQSVHKEREEPTHEQNTSRTAHLAVRNKKRKRNENNTNVVDSITMTSARNFPRKRPVNHYVSKTDFKKPGNNRVQGTSRKGNTVSKNSSETTRKPLNGLILAVSTLDVKGKKHSSGDSSYKEVSSACITLGASVTGQVHKRIFALICNESAVLNLTQRIRKATKMNHLIINVEWIRKCNETGTRVSYEEYLLNDLAMKVVESKQTNLNSSGLERKEDDCGNQFAIIPGAGWSEPITLGCCCVCHETGRDCEWCRDCDVTLALKSKSVKHSICLQVRPSS